jgi:hypothetical protein
METRPPAEQHPLAEGRYKCGCSRYALLDELPQICPVHREPQTLVSPLPDSEGER